MSNPMQALLSFLSLAAPASALPSPMVPGCVCVTRTCACTSVIAFASLASAPRAAAVAAVVETVQSVNGRSFVLSWEVV